MTIVITLILASLLIIGAFRTVQDFREEDPEKQVSESPVQAEEISVPLSEPQAEIIENPPHQAEEKKTAQKESSPVKKTPVKKTPAKKVPAKKTTPKK